MPNKARKLAEVQESEWTKAVGLITLGVVLTAVAAILFYFAGLWLKGSLVSVAHVALGLAMMSGVAIVCAAIYRAAQSRKIAGVKYRCPYCDKVNLFDANPSEDFECEFCNRTVRFENGEPVRVRVAPCPNCLAEHRVAVNVRRYVCDKCDKPFELVPEEFMHPGARASFGTDEQPIGLVDVYLSGVERSKENEVALKLQNVLVVNLPEARRLMLGASTRTPLMLCSGVPVRKGEAIQRQFQEIGATVVLTPVGGGPSLAVR